MTDHLTTERLREIAGSPGNGVLLTYTNLERSVCAELLAKREGCAAIGGHRDQLLDLARLDNEAAREAVLSGRENKFRFGAMTTRDAIAEVVQQRDAARAERDRYHDALVARHGGEPIALLSELDEARAEAEKLRAELERARALLVRCGRAVGGLKDLLAELAAVKRQRDELLASSEPVADALRDIAGDGHRAYLDAYESAVASILAASQPAQQPKPEGGAS